MGTIYIDRQGCELRVDGRTVAVYEDGGLLARVPGRLADRVVLACDMSVSTAALTVLADSGTGLVVVRRGKAAVLLGGPGGDAARRLKQYEMALSEEWRLKWSRRLVGAKLRAQMRFLREMAESRQDARAQAWKALDLLRRTEQACHSEAAGIDSLRGLEGSSAAAYFSAFREVFAPSLGFKARNRRPPKDPVNAALSLGYVLAYGAAATEIHGAGLDPHIGFYHAPEHGRASLACDLVEPLRARVDSLVWRLFQARQLRREHFKNQGDACLMSKMGRKAYYAAWREEEKGVSRTLRRTTGVLARALAGDEEERRLPTEPGSEAEQAESSEE